MNAWESVIYGDQQWGVDQGDVVAYLDGLPANSVDLIFTSPPYVMARKYLEGGKDLKIARKPDEWVAWMLTVCRAARRVCKGLCAFVVEGQTKKYRYDCTPVLLMADLHREGFHLRKPPIFQRYGICGSGGPDWLRNDYELVICFTQGGRLPWSNNVACGHPPKYAPGGEMSNRTQSGRRRNQWGMPINKDGSIAASERGSGNGDEITPRTRKPSHKIAGEDSEADLFGEKITPEAKDPWGGGHTSIGRTADGRPMKPGGKAIRHAQGEDVGGYTPPALANPGNVIDCGAVGGSNMGDAICHSNEAPFPERLVEFFIRSFCPPGGVVCDPMMGSGTTIAVAKKNNRRSIGNDLRASQVELTRLRVSEETSLLPGIEL